jgi:hypothetical protein
MEERASVIAEMRAMLRVGSSVPNLLRFIRERNQGRKWSSREALQLLMEAFFLDPSGLGAISASTSFGNGEIPDSDLNWLLLPRILETRSKWDQAEGNLIPSETWYSPFVKSLPDERRDQAESSRCCGVSWDCWRGLSDEDRMTLLMIESTRLSLSEDVKLLSALIECLQHRLNAADRPESR